MPSSSLPRPTWAGPALPALLLENLQDAGAPAGRAHCTPGRVRLPCSGPPAPPASLFLQIAAQPTPPLCFSSFPGSGGLSGAPWKAAVHKLPRVSHSQKGGRVTPGPTPSLLISRQGQARESAFLPALGDVDAAGWAPRLENPCSKAAPAGALHTPLWPDAHITYPPLSNRHHFCCRCSPAPAPGRGLIPLDQRFSTQVTLPLGLPMAATGMGKDRPTPMSTHPQEKH